MDRALTDMPHPLPRSVISLQLHSNKIMQLGTNLSSLPLLERLDLSNNSLTALTNDSLRDLYQLRHLDLSVNAIAAIPSTVFASLAAIQELSLVHNQLTELDNQQLFGLQSLRVLNLAGNFISHLSNQTFFYLHSLEVLDLSYNSLNHLPHDAFQGLVSVRSIYLHHNYLHNVHATFTSLPQVQLLDLSFNTLDTLDEWTFAGLTSLKTLDLSFNNITRISPLFCGNKSHIKTLNLRSNSISKLQDPVFKHLKELHELDLSQMPFLQSVSHDAFGELQSLTALNLSHNPQLFFLHPQLLAPMPELAVVDLRSNSLPTLSKVTFNNNPHLKRLYLADNQFECDCGLAWISQQLKNKSDYLQIMCVQQPNNYSGNDNSATPTPLHKMPQEMMQCNNVTLLNVTNFVSARIGSQLVLQCDYDADETGILTWITPHGLMFHYHPFHPDATAHLVEANDTENLTSKFHASHWWHDLSSYNSDIHSNRDHIVLQSDGSLYIDYVLRNDAGPYQCVVHNAHNNVSATITLWLDHHYLYDMKNMSYLVGFSCAACFFTLNTVYVVIMWIARRLVNKRRRERLRKMLESLDEYRTTQMTRIRNNYSNQLVRIRDHYHTQSMRLRLNYTTQMKRVRRGCSNQCERIRDNYHNHMSSLKDYSSHQILQIREATNNQIVRIRDYGQLQMERIRETYKLQHQHVMKIIEAMNLENCRTVVETECMRTESMIFDVDFSPDFDDTSNEETFSQSSPSESVYATALNSDGSSQDSLNTVVNCVHVTELQAEVLPNDYDSESPLHNTQPTPEDTGSINLSETDVNEETVYITMIDSVKETFV